MKRNIYQRLGGLWMREGIRGLARHLLRRPSLRQRYVARYASPSGPGLEIGPSHSPLAPKARGFCVDILDHADAAALRAKYQGTEVDVGNIEDVDYVWKGEPLSETIGRKSCYEWIIASHVIEHTPDLVGFLIECQTLLRESGRLILVVPDKRYCFDRFQSLTSTGDALDAHRQQLTKPSPGRVFDHFANAVKKGRGGVIAWHRHAPGKLRMVHTVEGARAAWQDAQQGDHYVDVHNWHFTPESFRLVVEDLRELGLIELGFADGPAGSGGEFCVCLQRVPLDRKDRLTSLTSIGNVQR
ncbi:MAG: hypothetical protein WAM90_16860 [Rhodanobacter sp.]